MPQIESTSFARPDAHLPHTTRGKLCPRCQTMYTQDAEEGDYCARDGAELVASDRVFAGKYLLGQHLGFGQTGDVYSAIQAGVGRQVALKILRADQADNPEVVKRFEHEAQIASSIDHANAVTIFESGRSPEGQAYIAMELLAGETLERRLQREGPLAPGAALALLLPVVRAVAAAHGRGVVHRDLKPDNIFIARKEAGHGDSPDEVVKVLDFGIAGRVTSLSRSTPPDVPLGTPLYMAPEQLQGNHATLRSDVYALGIILTEVLTGRLPWGETAATTSPSSTMGRLVRPPYSLSELLPRVEFPEPLQQLISQALARDPQQRPPDAGAMLRQLQPIALSLAGGLHPALASPRQTPPGFAPSSQVTSSPFIDSTATLSGRETRPLTRMPLRKRWLIAGGALLAAGLIALLWRRQATEPMVGLGHGPIQQVRPAAERAATAEANPARNGLQLPAPAPPNQGREPAPAGATRPTSVALASDSPPSTTPPPDEDEPASTSRRHRHRHREPSLAADGERAHHHRSRTTAGLGSKKTAN
jgi:serine/threonine-protein kinase